MRAKIVHLICANPHFDIYHNNSAVSKYLRQVAEVLERMALKVLVNGRVFNKNYKHFGQSTNQKKVHRVLLSKVLVPKSYFHNSLKDVIYFKKQAQIGRQIIGEISKGDFVIEFLTYGSNWGILAKLKGAHLTTLYDAPLKLQYFENYKNGSFFLHKIEQNEMNSLMQSDHILCYSPSVKDYIQNEINVSMPISTFPCLIWEESISPKKKEQVRHLGFIGSFLSWHKVDLLIKVFGQIVKKNQHQYLHLTLVGYGEMWNECQTLVDHLNLNDVVTLTGFVSDNELKKIKSTFDLALMPASNWYGSPLKLFEYAFAGIPFIGPATPTVQDLCNGYHIPLVSAENLESDLENKIIFYLENPDLAYELALEQKNWLSQFGKDKFAEIINSSFE